MKLSDQTRELIEVWEDANNWYSMSNAEVRTTDKPFWEKEVARKKAKQHRRQGKCNKDARFGGGCSSYWY